MQCSSSQTRCAAGLGLSIARRIITLHGGELTAAHPSQGGSEFAFWLPRSSRSVTSE
ncbi:MAG: sensor histidine kinase [Acidobacteria bacterium]|nr:sensor histidine kinase [Acidobacteriota bacterium]